MEQEVRGAKTMADVRNATKKSPNLRECLFACQCINQPLSC